MQKGVRVNEIQLLQLATKSRTDSTLNGYLYKRSTDTGKWRQRWFTLYQNLLFYYENENCLKPSGMALLEGCYCERIVVPGSGRGKEAEKQVGLCSHLFLVFFFFIRASRFSQLNSQSGLYEIQFPVFC